jgi:S-formylglutathione hydrolase FrmB
MPPRKETVVQEECRGLASSLHFADATHSYHRYLPAENCDIVKLTKDPDGRATTGCSSGGAAAMAMAWYHTDLYHRVLSYSGTFVHQQWPYNPETPHGAWEFHETLIPTARRSRCASGCM